jgi:hypothetical protein
MWNVRKNHPSITLLKAVTGNALDDIAGERHAIIGIGLDITVGKQPSNPGDDYCLRNLG